MTNARIPFPPKTCVTSLARESKGSLRDVSVRCLPQTDGGEGFVSILTLPKGGNLRTVKAHDALGRERTVRIGLLAVESLNKEVVDLLRLPSKGKIALIEMASVVGLADLKTEERNPWKPLRLESGNACASAANGVFAQFC